MSAPAPVDPLVALTDRCVQCGLCLPVCPTHRYERIEAESPRGRIAIVRAWADGALEPTATGDAHLDACLGCRRCEAACPAGVQYGALLVEARARQRVRRTPPIRQRAIETLTAHPRLLSRLLGLYRRVHPVLPATLRPLPCPPRPDASLPRVADEDVALFVGCVARAYEPAVRTSLTRLCRAAGTPLSIPATQTCCGALHAHAGDTATAERLSARNAAALSGAARVLTLASGCHSAVESATGGARTVDALVHLDGLADQLVFKPLVERIALHRPCTLHATPGALAATRRLLARVPGLEVVELDAGHGCCGAAGTHMLTEPARAAAFRAPLIDALQASGATRLLSANIGCRLHLARATGIPVQHPLELLADALVN
ncbi:(Fe-S)-binding protein [Cognatilysobacter bugurensis]|uniref:Glycolate oxidase iron-sulfur subunit n=1 Tax=Cognatilysobacter bugurensis TaxID=543356 RepID=A0A918T2V1_9GAMM|nr:(Fe-S)-binding protein [Lysobacter bugurensis]GHA85797.1 glycolate oxidase iron-sulfur subunit [Lysobacter bugurensis]